MDGAGDEFFARSGGAYEQNIRVVPRDLAGEVEDFKHGGAFADDAVEFEVLQELFFQGANAAALIVE